MANRRLVQQCGEGLKLAGPAEHGARGTGEGGVRGCPAPRGGEACSPVITVGGAGSSELLPEGLGLGLDVSGWVAAGREPGPARVSLQRPCALSHAGAAVEQGRTAGSGPTSAASVGPRLTPGGAGARAAAGTTWPGAPHAPAPHRQLSMMLMLAQSNPQLLALIGTRASLARELERVERQSRLEQLSPAELHSKNRSHWAEWLLEYRWAPAPHTPPPVGTPGPRGRAALLTLGSGVTPEPGWRRIRRPPATPRPGRPSACASCTRTTPSTS